MQTISEMLEANNREIRARRYRRKAQRFVFGLSMTLALASVFSIAIEWFLKRGFAQIVGWIG